MGTSLAGPFFPSPRVATSDVALQGLNRLKRGMVAALNRIWIGFCHFSILLSVQALARLGKFVPETQAIDC